MKVKDLINLLSEQGDDVDVYVGRLTKCARSGAPFLLPCPDIALSNIFISRVDNGPVTGLVFTTETEVEKSNKNKPQIMTDIEELTKQLKDTDDRIEIEVDK